MWQSGKVWLLTAAEAERRRPFCSLGRLLGMCEVKRPLRVFQDALTVRGRRMGEEQKKGKPFRKSPLEWGKGGRGWPGRVSRFGMWSLGSSELWYLHARGCWGGEGGGGVGGGGTGGGGGGKEARTMSKVCDVGSG